MRKPWIPACAGMTEWMRGDDGTDAWDDGMDAWDDGMDAWDDGNGAGMTHLPSFPRRRESRASNEKGPRERPLFFGKAEDYFFSPPGTLPSTPFT